MTLADPDSGRQGDANRACAALNDVTTRPDDAEKGVESEGDGLDDA